MQGPELVWSFLVPRLSMGTSPDVGVFWVDVCDWTGHGAGTFGAWIGSCCVSFYGQGRGRSQTNSVSWVAVKVNEVKHNYCAWDVL